MLASTDGIVPVKAGQWVENRREVRSLTLQAFDDVNLAASGVVAIKSSGDVVVHAQGDLRIRDQQDMLTRGIESGARMRLEATGSILTNHAGSDPILRSAGDMILVAQGVAGVTGGVIGSNAGALRVEIGEFGLQLPGNDGWLPGTLQARAKGDIDVVALGGHLLLAGVASSAGDVTLQAWDGSILGSARSFDRGIVHVAGQDLSLEAGNVVDAQQAPGTRNIGSLLAALDIDADTLQARTHTALRSVIAVEDADDLTIAGEGLVVERQGQFVVRAGADLTVQTRLRVAADEGGAVLLEAVSGTLTVADVIDVAEGVVEEARPLLRRHVGLVEQELQRAAQRGHRRLELV